VAVSEQSAGLRRYADVLAFPGVARIVVAALLGRLPNGMAPLAAVLLIRGEGRSYAVAGVVVAANSLASAAGSPLFGRLVDRTGQSRVLLWLAFVYPATLAALALLATHGAPVAALVVVSALAGATVPPVGACMRALWPELVSGPGLRDVAYAFEAWVQEVFFICGPLIVAAVASLFVPWVAVMTAAACALVGTAWFALAPAVRAIAPTVHAGGRGGALASSALRTVMLASFTLGMAFGVVEVLMPAFGEAHGSRSQGGFALAFFACGSLIGGLWIGTRPPARRLSMRFAISLGVLALALLPPLVAPSIPVMCLLMLVAGMPIAPAFAASYGLIDELGVPGTTTEAFSWLTTAIVAGLAVGTSAGGAAIDPLGITGALALAAPCAGLAALVAFARHDTLTIPDAVPCRG
jgi:MFS family permease